MATSLRRPPLVESVCALLREQHRSAEWLPPERKLAATLGVSRPVLREAIKRLEHEGLLASRHGVGVQVVDQPHLPVGAALERALPSPAERVRQFTAARSVVEPELARLAAEHVKPAGLRRLQAAQSRLADCRDFADAVEADLEFHRSIAEVSGNQVLALMLASMAGLEAASRRVTLERVGLRPAWEQHQLIVDAIAAHDPDRAEAAMRAHLAAAQATLPRSRRSSA
jgi:DNA-binding FadR family transcriptional regulator